VNIFAHQEPRIALPTTDDEHVVLHLPPHGLLKLDLLIVLSEEGVGLFRGRSGFVAGHWLRSMRQEQGAGDDQLRIQLPLAIQLANHLAGDCFWEGDYDAYSRREVVRGAST
jgi:hypothetical protein